MDKEIKVRVSRYDSGKSWHQDYQVRYAPPMTVLDLLHIISQEQDPSLAFRSSCGMGKCGSCALSVNGRPVLSCQEMVRGDEILIEPLPNFPVIKDLIVARDRYEEGIVSFFEGKPTFPLMPPRPPDDPAWPECIECLLCDGTCPVVAESPDLFYGPAYLMSIPGLDPQISQSQLKSLTIQNYLCIACQNCDTNCPAAVKPGHNIEINRGKIEKLRHRSIWERALRRLIFHGLFPHPRRLEALGSLLRLYQRSLQGLLHRVGAISLLPSPLDTMEALLPPLPGRFFPASFHHQPAEGERRGVVTLFPGCIMNIPYSPINWATMRVLANNGYDTVVPAGEVCCGAPHMGAGEVDMAKALARRNLDILSAVEAEALITNCAACGAMLKGYGELLEDDQVYAAKASAFSRKVRDISEFLAVNLSSPLGELRKRVTYHDACHLVHAQGIADQPRQLLRSIPGLEFIELKGSDRCCGSGGVYNITHGDISERVLMRKVDNIAATGAEAVVTSNPGCLMQLRYGLRKAKIEMEVLHLVEILEQAYKLKGSRN